MPTWSLLRRCCAALVVMLAAGCGPRSGPATAVPSSAAAAGSVAASAPVGGVRHPDPRHCAGVARTYDGSDGCRSDGELVRVTHALDATTLAIDDGRRVRLLGVAAPDPGSCPAAQATAVTEAAVGGQEVNLVAEPGAGRDEFGSTWAYVQYGPYTGHDLGAQLALDGWVTPYPASPANPAYRRAVTGAVDIAVSLRAGRHGPPCGPPEPPEPAYPADGPTDDPAPTGGGTGPRVDVDVDHDDHHHRSRFCRKHWWC
jgi:hypothetical protein